MKLDWNWLVDFIAGNPPLLRAGEWICTARRQLATAAMSLLIVILGYHVVFGANGMVAYQHKRAEHRKLQQEIERVQQDNQRISQNVRELKSNPKAIEREAREQFKYARPGEVVYISPEPNPQAPAATAQKR